MIDNLKEIVIQELSKEITNDKSMWSYLMLTSKVELPIRDLIAWRLHERLDPDYIVSREWKRCDLAILSKEGFPLFLIEFKACYHFDLYREKNFENFREKLESDFTKSKNMIERLGDPRIEFLNVLLVTKPKNVIKEALKNVVKYSANINNTLLKVDSLEILDIHGKDNLEGNFNLIQHSALLRDGNVYNVKCDLDAYILEP
jgi:hypothetical protein